MWEDGNWSAAVSAVDNPEVGSGAPLHKSASTLLNALHAEGISYCHWKSNQHVRAGLDGATDLDILVARRHARKVQEVLAATGYKQFSSSPSGAYSAVEDYLGFEPDSGDLIHLHLHYRLVLGEKHLKGYCLPWEEELLGRRRFDREHGIYTAPPDSELLLLLLRSALKIRARDWLKGALGRTYFGKDDLAEYRWLHERTDVTTVGRLTDRLLGAEAAAAIRPLLEQPPMLAALARLRQAAAPALSLHRSYGAVEARARRWAREATWFVGALNKKFLRRPWRFRKSLPTGGLLVAVVGADGAGKTTLLAELAPWLGWKLDVFQVYHGSGDGRASLLRAPLVLLKPLFKRRSGTSTGAGRGRPGWARGGWALVLALEKRGKLQDSWRARDRGMVVLADRYPQNQVAGFNDGPLLAAWDDRPLLHRLAAWEGAAYRWADARPPDLVIKLDIDADTAFRRKPDDDMDLEEVERRVRAVAGLRFPGADVVTVDARRPREQVILEVKRAIWERL